MSNSYFQFQQFMVRHDRCAMKVGTDGVLLGGGAHLSRCIVMQDTCIAADAILQYVIADKNVRIGPAVTLTGCEALPIVIPKGSEL